MIKEVVNIAKSNPAMTIKDSFNIFIDAYNENHKVTQIEKTKRAEISAHSQIELEKIRSQRAILEKYLEGIFDERKLMINGMFDTLDKGIENGNNELIQQSLGAIVAIAKESPLAGIQNLINDYNNDNIKSITI
jgi:hypothetical protein